MTLERTYHPNQPILLAEGNFAIRIGKDVILQDARVVERLSPSPRLQIELIFPQDLTAYTPEQQRLSLLVNAGVLSPDAKERLQFQYAKGKWVEVLAAAGITDQQRGGMIIRTSPSVVLAEEQEIGTLHFDVLNVTSSIFDNPTKFHWEGLEIEVTPRPDLPALTEQLRQHSGYCVTHQVTVTNKGDSVLTKEDAELVLDCFEQFVSFVCGSGVGITSVRGIDHDGRECWVRWGSRSASPWIRRRSWASQTSSAALDGLFNKFQNLYGTDKLFWDRVLGWYVASNESTGADVAIILNQVILEALTQDAIGDRIDGEFVGDWMKRALDLYSIDSSVPQTTQQLATFAAGRKWLHGPQALVGIRDSLVHSKVKHRLPSVEAYAQSRHLGLKYIELAILKLLDYKGDYIDRIRSFDSAAHKEKVPWAK